MLPAEIADGERLAIYVLDSAKMKADGVHWRAFMPSYDDGERSLFRVDGLNRDEKAALGVTHVAAPAVRPLRGWAEILARDVRSRPPLLVLAAEPPPRHGVITHWPLDSNAQKLLAIALAGVAKTERCSAER